MSNNKSRSGRPYDPNNSFVKKVASRVSGLIPRPTSWLSGWFSAGSEDSRAATDNVETISNEEERFEDALEKPPASKRFKVTADGQYVNTFNRCQTADQDNGSSRLPPSNFIDTSAIAGPSGLSSRSSGFVSSTPAVTAVDHLEPKANGDDCSESGESTSGCSSLEPQITRALPNTQNQSRQSDTISPRKRLLDDKLNYSYLQHSRSMYLDHTSNSRNSQTVGRRNNPSFCVSTFRTPLFGERGSVNDLILNSPFYSGRTTYGGASSASYRRSLGSTSLSSSPANSEKRHTIKVKPGNTSTEDSGMSQTAKRILATLEQFSTPILDAKRIPVTQEPVLANLGSRKRTRADDSLNSQLVLEQPRVPKRVSNKPVHWAKGGPNTSQLTIPSVPDTLIFRKRDIVLDNVASSTSTNAEPYKLRTENENTSTRNTLKMKPRINDTKEPKEPEMAPEVNLPAVPLPISSLPTFDITVPAPKSDVVKPPQEPSGALKVAPKVAPKPSEVQATTPKPQQPVFSSPSVPSTKSTADMGSTDASFSFSSPIPVSSGSKDQPLSPMNNFTFSKPLPASMNFSTPTPNSVKPRPKAVSDSPKPSESFLGGLKPASELKSGSVMDILGKSTNDSPKKVIPTTNGEVSLMDKFKPAPGTWECNQCFIRNKSDSVKCAACENPRQTKDSSKNQIEMPSKKQESATDSMKVDTGFGAQFKMSQGMWECSACMVRNKDSDTKCVSCTTPKPGSAPVKVATSSAPASGFSGWGDKFKPPSNTWECSVCMVRNGSELSACQSCTTKKPGSSSASDPSPTTIKSSWGDQFKKPEGSWTCGDCMISNKAADNSCVACSAKKPGSESSGQSSTEAPKFSFGIPPASQGSSTPAFSFGIPKDKAATEVEKSSVTSSTGFKFGESKSDAPTATFSFGIPSASASTAPPTSQQSLFSSVASPSTSDSVKPVFGAKPAETNASVSQPTASPKPTFSFGVASNAEVKSTPPSTPSFSFSKPAASAAPSPVASPALSQPASSSGSPLGGKRKLNDDASSSSAVPIKFGAASNFASTQVNPLLSNASSVSSTSGPVFSSSSPFASNPPANVLSAAVTSTANGQSANEPAKTTSPSSIFSGLVSTSTSSSTPAKPATTFGMGLSASKDESVTSTWKQPTNNISSFGSKEVPQSNGTPAAPKPAFTFGSNVSSSGMAFGSNASSGTATFTFGATADKTASTAKPSVTFGTPNSSTNVFGSGTSNILSANQSFASTGSTGFSLSTPASAVPSFQATAASASAAPSIAPAFGGVSEEKKPMFSFGATSENKKTGFAFSAPDEKKPSFSFGATEEPKKAGFSFSSTNATSPPNPSGVFTFGSAPAANPAAPAATASAPALNGPAKPAFSFGSSSGSFSSFNSQPPQPQASTPAFGFGSFGASENNAAPAASPFGATNSMFQSPSTNFNSPFSAPSVQPSGGFNFSSPAGFGGQNTAPSGAFSFDGSQKPAFNFGGNPSGAPISFAATPQESPAAGQPVRRIKKAARRTQR